MPSCSTFLGHLMMRLCSIFAAVLVLPLASHATTYDVKDLSELGQLCSHKSFSIESDGTTYRCTGEIVLPAGDKIISSLPEKEITLEAAHGIVLEGNNTIGEPNKRISLHALATGLTVNNEKASSIDDYQNKHTVIYGDLLSAYPTKLLVIFRHTARPIYSTLTFVAPLNQKAINCISRRRTLSNDISSSVTLWRTVLCLLMTWRSTALLRLKEHLPH
jgi:hypothetical protein